jgi:hypothetical protein
MLALVVCIENVSHADEYSFIVSSFAENISVYRPTNLAYDASAEIDG